MCSILKPWVARLLRTECKEHTEDSSANRCSPTSSTKNTANGPGAGSQFTSAICSPLLAAITWCPRLQKLAQDLEETCILAKHWCRYSWLASCRSCWRVKAT